MHGDQLAEDRTEICGQIKVALLVELLLSEAGPLAIDLTSANAAPHGHHVIGVTMIGSAIAVFLGRPAEFAHGDDRDVRHAVAHILVEGGERLPERPE